MSKSTMKNTDVPGSAVGSHAAYLRQMVRQAETLQDLERTADRLFEEELLVRGITIRFPEDARPEYLAVVRVEGPGGRLVAFHNAPTFIEVVVGVVNRLKNGTMKFKEDQYG